MLKGYLRKRHESRVVQRFVKVLPARWDGGKYHVYIHAGEVLEIIVEMKDPTQPSGIGNYSGTEFEGYIIKVNKAPHGYINAYYKTN